MKIKAYLTIGFPGAKQEEVLEVDDEATEEDIEAEVSEWAHNYIEFGWRKQ